LVSAAPKVSVIIPTYNRAEMLMCAVRSALTQTFSDLELIVIDDGSSDGSVERLAEFGADPRLCVVRNKVPSGRPALPRNAGLARARGEFVAFLDSDDRWYPEKLATQLEYLEANPDCALVSGRCRWVGAEERLWPELLERAFRYEDLVAGNVIACSMTMVRRSVVTACGGFDTRAGLRLGEDWDLWLRIAQRHAFAVLPDVLGEYTVHAGGVSRHKARELLGRISVLTLLSAREPRFRAELERRIGALRRELSRELWSRRRFATAARVRLGLERGLEF
jgi:glycosyltransferase involved in cell wall biosynthesis